MCLSKKKTKIKCNYLIGPDGSIVNFLILKVLSPSGFMCIEFVRTNM